MYDKNLFSVSYLPLTIRLKCREPVKLPAYLGSMLHGTLGWALLPQQKVYRYLFENRRRSAGHRDIVNPYIINTPPQKTNYQENDELVFQILLLGDGIKYAEDFVNVMTETSVFGLGAGRAKFELVDIRHGVSLHPIWDGEHLWQKEMVASALVDEIYENCQYCSIQMKTPLRIRRDGELLTQIDMPAIMRNITRRISDIVDRYGGYIDREKAETICDMAREIKQKNAEIYVCHLERYSSRKGEKMDMSGVMGSLAFQGELTAFTPWLNAASVLHIGRNVTFGYGQVNVVFV